MTKVKTEITLASIKARLADVKRNHQEDIDRGAFLRVSAAVFDEMEWLVQQLEQYAE